MKVLTHINNWNEKDNLQEIIDLATNMNDLYNKSVIFHCYWNGELNEKHLISIRSCYYFHVFKNKHKIILWLENNIPNKYNEIISNYAEIKYFNLNNENSNFKNYNIHNYDLSYYSDIVRYMLLYKYGGCWFDLDVLFLRSFDPLFYNYENEICVYQWEYQNYPNGAIYISLLPYSDKMKKNIEFIINRNRGWGFQEANLTYDINELDLLVLPCSWFDINFIFNSYNINNYNFFINTDKKYNFDNFFKGLFCYHWHNRWNEHVHENSIFKQLDNIIIEKMQL